MYFKNAYFPDTVILGYSWLYIFILYMNYKQNKFYANHNVEYFRIIIYIQNLKYSIVY